MSADMSNPEVIYLQPECCAGSAGQLWCRDNVFDDGCCEDGNLATKYIRADMVASERAALPPDPAPETIEAMWDAMGRVGLSRSAVVTAYHALRTGLLPGEEPS